ncbi:HU family DNA-binding protein [Pseudomonas amygdali]|uniref:HU family DNA-binding protein n=1 Tax=Pseudomonas amygdali TaxID=47877 RepID=UPI0006E56F5E|nr:HU family DNA-binding protein [Pseudomonas amygdali]KPY55719.1 hypothetical protein ALO93_200053 [Pseudomonas amygdali pv. sesami]
MNRTELIERVAEDLGVSKASTARYLDAFIAQIEEALASNSRVTLSGFGRFENYVRADRNIRDANTGTQRRFPSALKPRFVPARTLKQLVERRNPIESQHSEE